MIKKTATSLSEADTLHDVNVHDLVGASAEQIAQALASYERRLDSMGLLVGGIAHDMNNLLLVIGGFSELLQRSNCQPDLLHASVGGLGEATRQLSSLTRILSSLASKRIPAFEAIDVNDILASMDNTIAHLLGDNITLEIRPDPSHGLIRAVRGHLERVVLNLVMNARDAMPAHGRLTIEARSVRIDERNPRHGLRPGRYVVLSVTDTGCGMSAATIQRIFDPLFTTKESTETRGYGLHTVRRIVHDCGGEVFVESEPGQGACFEIFLPQCEE